MHAVIKDNHNSIHLCRYLELVNLMHREPFKIGKICEDSHETSWPSYRQVTGKLTDMVLDSCSHPIIKYPYFEQKLPVPSHEVLAKFRDD